MRLAHWKLVRRVALAVASAGLVACGDRPSAAPAEAGSTPLPGDAFPDTLATIGREPITMADIRAHSGAELDRMEAAYRRARATLVEGTLRRIVRERVLMAEATKRGKSVDRMILDEAGGTLEATDAEIAAWYEQNRSRIQDRRLEEVRNRIADLLRAQRRQQAMERLEAGISDARDVRIFLEPLRFTFDNTGAPEAGSREAKVTLVEFSDFQCPYCARFVPTLEAVRKNYGDRVHIVYRQFPISSLHAHAFKAAEASLCAHEQGRFWQMHDAMFQQQSRLSVPELKVFAGQLGMDQGRFDACLDSGRHAAQIRKDLAEGASAGISGTPAIFVNGVEIEGGAVSYETVARILDRELAR
ncbi:MAG TPA: DsbA family protein [Gemmatimonadales bacterium]|nr:DsbA family protein [Gemmatimonadales bacterium]